LSRARATATKDTKDGGAAETDENINVLDDNAQESEDVGDRGVVSLLDGVAALDGSSVALRDRGRSRGGSHGSGGLSGLAGGQADGGSGRVGRSSVSRGVSRSGLDGGSRATNGDGVSDGDGDGSTRGAPLSWGSLDGSSSEGKGKSSNGFEGDHFVCWVRKSDWVSTKNVGGLMRV